MNIIRNTFEGKQQKLSGITVPLCRAQTLWNIRRKFAVFDGGGKYCR